MSSKRPPSAPRYNKAFSSAKPKMTRHRWCRASGRSLLQREGLQSIWNNYKTPGAVSSNVTRSCVKFSATVAEMTVFTPKLSLERRATVAQPAMEVRKCDEPDALAFLHSLTPVLPSDKPPHVLLICDTGIEICLPFRISHALIDGTSMCLLMNDLVRVYRGMLEADGPPYELYIAYIYNKPVYQSLSYWSDTLAKARRCHFSVLVDAQPDDRVRPLNKITRLVPGVEATRQLGRTHGVSIANFLQVAGALVLRAFGDGDDVGYLYSGRDVPVDQKIVGTLQHACFKYRLQHGWR
ncbi:hypothetical protein FNYG_08093 [Fusarium nygamai]|uniref:Condensation domain-containing protein n=1 Tax=Gibberella nygamai TaxID=42673 RepID=A0A2K0W8D1_GIBNY|nr:hypothetical protein FNYG_08093 [Fusarium nygamai]